MQGTSPSSTPLSQCKDVGFSPPDLELISEFLNLTECLVQGGSSSTFAKLNRPRGCHKAQRDWLPLSATQGASIQMPRQSLDWKGCMKIFHLGNTQHVWVHSQGWSEQNRSDEGRCSAPPADSLLIVSGESLANLQLRGGEMLIQKPLVLGGEVNQNCERWADFVTGRREEGSWESNVSMAWVTYPRRMPSPSRLSWVWNLRPSEDPH